MRNKIASFIAGCICSVILLECALRMTGALVEDRRAAPRPVAPGICRIVCFGDSFTYGEGAPEKESYPIQLGELLNGAVKSGAFEVVNMGRPAQNTTQLLSTLPDVLALEKPKVAIILTGGYNLSNYYGYLRYAEGATLKARVRDQIYRIRIYKLVNHVIDNIVNRVTARRIQRNRIYRGARPADKRETEYDVCISRGDEYKRQRRYRQAREYFEKALQIDPRRPEGYDEIGLVHKELSELDQATEYFKKAISVDSHYSPAYNNLGWIHINRRQFAVAMGLFKKAILLDPGFAPNYSAMASVYRFTPDDTIRRDVKAFLGKLKYEMHIENPSLANTLALIEDEERGQGDAVERWIAHDIGKVIDICKAHGVAVIMQGYPGGQLNVILKDVAETHQVPFVENCAVFEELLKTIPRQGLFASDNGHCNGRGYGIMARNVYEMMLRQGIVPGTHGGTERHRGGNGKSL
jgi:tetratricopeptide (TPR) repeat protein